MTDKMIVACPECRTRFVAPLEKFLPNGRKVRCAKCSHSWFQRVGEEPEPLPAAAPAPKPKPAPVSRADDAQKTAARETPKPETTHAVETTARQGTASTESEDTARDATPEKAASDKPRSTIEDSVARKEADRVAATSASAGATATVTTGYAAASPSASGTGRRMPEGAVPPIPTKEKRGGGFWRTLFYCLAALIVLAALAYVFRQPLSERFPALADPLDRFAQKVDGAVATVLPPDTPLRIENVKYDYSDDGERAILLTADVVNGGETAVDAPKLSMKILAADGGVLHETSISPEDLTETIEPAGRSTYFIRVPSPPPNIDRVEVDFANGT